MGEKLSPTDSQIVAFVQKNADYYLKKWRAIERSGSRISWNWASFIFNLSWMFYRKMYKEGIIIYLLYVTIFSLGIPLLLKYANVLIVSVPLSLVYYLLVIVFPFVFGMFGNYIYYRKLIGILEDLKKQNVGEEQIEEILRSKGGVSWLGAILFVILSLVVSSLLQIFIFSSMLGGELQ